MVILCALPATCPQNAVRVCLKMSRIGIYSGSFDPIHKGHIAFALAAIESAKLDIVYFAPEARPRRKPGVTHLGHRLAMIRLATRLHHGLEMLELPDKYFSANTTIPRLRQLFPDDELLLLLGSDLFESMPHWPNVKFLLESMGLIVAVRGHSDIAKTLQRATQLPYPSRELHIIENDKSELASSYIRQTLAAGHRSPDILPSVHVYARQNWLYDDVTSAKKRV